MGGGGGVGVGRDGDGDGDVIFWMSQYPSSLGDKRKHGGFN
jgi:hypothetical protein